MRFYFTKEIEEEKEGKKERFLSFPVVN